MPHVTAPVDCYLVARSIQVKAGDTVEVDDETAMSLIEQGWTVPRRAPGKHDRPSKDEPAAE